jgi:Nitrogen regulatory protein P-II
MNALQTIRRVTVYADAALESIVIEIARRLGSKGYSATACRGKGKHEVLEDPGTGATLVRLEFLVQPAVGEKILQYLDCPEFRRRAIAACMEEVSVVGSDDF